MDNKIKQLPDIEKYVNFDGITEEIFKLCKPGDRTIIQNINDYSIIRELLTSEFNLYLAEATLKMAFKTK